MARPAPLLLVYDAECPFCRKVADWAQRRDTEGLVVAFPHLNAELVRVAPELAGLPFQGEIYALDTRTRAIHQGRPVLGALLLRLPGLRWLAPWAGMGPIARIILFFITR